MNWPDSGHWNRSGLKHTLQIVFSACFAVLGIAACSILPQLQQRETGIVPSATVIPVILSPSDTPLPAVMQTDTAVFSSSPDPADCYVAIAGNPLDVAIPDGTVMDPGELFTKIWRIRNAGSCVWTDQYHISWFSGDDLGTSQTVPILENVNPGDTAEIEVDMKAPMQAGMYQSNWKICSPDNVCFGLGPEGAYPFWTKIQVRQLATATITPKPTLTPTVVVLMHGFEVLHPDEFVDLDSGDTDSDNKADIQLIEEDGTLQLSVMNNAKATVFGPGTPNEQQCSNMLYVNQSILLADVAPTTALCYKSSLGLPGYIRILGMDTLTKELQIEYITWYAP